jgi:hypothetical protein
MKYYTLTKRNGWSLIDENDLNLLLESNECTVDELEWHTGWKAMEQNYNILEGCSYQSEDMCLN